MTVSLRKDHLQEPPGNTTPARPKLRIAVPHDSSHGPSVIAAGHELLRLPEIPDSHFDRPMQQRIQDGEVYRNFFENNPVDLLLDIETSALTFVRDSIADDDSVAMTHTLFNIPYVASFIDPVTETMHKMSWPMRWQLLENPGWIKWVADDAHASELRRLGVPNVMSMSMATVDGDYCTDPLPHHAPGAPVGFLGQPATGWFKNESDAPKAMRAGLIAAAAKADAPDLTFQDVYYDMYGFAEPPNPSESPAERAQKSGEYFSAKFAYNVYLAVKARDRFVLFLKNKLGDQFELIGNFWDANYAIPNKPWVFGRENINKLYRNFAICLNLYKGNFETGLNLRQYEVTATGGFLLTYKKAELAKDFELGKECVVFDNERDLLDKIRYYLAHPEERIEIALAGQRRTLNNHLYSHRINTLVALIGQTQPSIGNG